jgi:hypothetical protein
VLSHLVHADVLVEEYILVSFCLPVEDYRSDQSAPLVLAINFTWVSGIFRNLLSLALPKTIANHIYFFAPKEWF